MKYTIAGLHSLYILAGIDQYYLVNVHFTHVYTDTDSLAALRSYYNEAARRYGIDPSYLASINFIESNFGRVKDTSSAGAQGPMQFLPSTWTQYGQGGDIHNSHERDPCGGALFGPQRRAVQHAQRDLSVQPRLRLRRLGRVLRAGVSHRPRMARPHVLLEYIR